MSETTMQLRQKNLDATEKMAQFESPDGDAVCASYIDRSVADQLGEFAELTISEDADVTASLSDISGSNDDGNYGVYETPGGAVTGLYVSHESLAAIHGNEATPENAPETIGLKFSPSSEDEWEEAESVDEDEVEGLLGGSDEEDESDEEEVEISDEELDLVDAE